MELSQKQAEEMLRHFTWLRLKHNLYECKEYPAIANYLNGFQDALRILQIYVLDDIELLDKIADERGWDVQEKGSPLEQMLENDWNDNQIADELIVILASILQRRYGLSEDIVKKIEENHAYLAELLDKKLSDE